MSENAPTPADDVVEALGKVLDIIDESYRKYNYDWDGEDIHIFLSARNLHQAALAAKPDQPAVDAGLVVDEQIALWHSSNCELHEWLGWTEAEYHDWVADPTKIPRLPQYALTQKEAGSE